MNIKLLSITTLSLFIFFFSSTSALAQCKIDKIISISGNVEYACGSKQSALYIPHEVRNKSHEILGRVSPRFLKVEIKAGDINISSWVNGRGWPGTGLSGGKDTRALYIRAGEDTEHLENAILSGTVITATLTSPEGKTFTLFSDSFPSSSSKETAIEKPTDSLAQKTVAQEDLSSVEQKLSHAFLNNQTAKKYLDRKCVIEIGVAKRNQIRDSRISKLQEDIANNTMRENQLNATKSEITKLKSNESATLKPKQLLGAIINDGDCRSQEKTYQTYIEECKLRSNTQDCECQAKHFSEKWVSGARKEWPNELKMLQDDAQSACRR